MATRLKSWLFLALALSLTAPASRAQTAPVPTAFPVPFTSAVAGLGTSASSTCSANLLATDGTNYGDGCAGTLARLSSPQGAAVDKYGNVYVADYSDRLVRVLYNGGAALAAAITAANSGYAISSSRTAPATVPVPGRIYTLAGVGANLTLVASGSTTPGGFGVTAADGKYACADYASSGQPEAIDSLGDGCPAAAATIGPRDVAVDNDGNLILTDYTNNRIRILCVNCTNTAAASLIKTENPGVTPVNGAMYTVAGFTIGYRDQYLGFGNPTTPETTVSLLRDPTAAVVSPSDDIFIADNLNNAVRLLYNGGTAAKNILTAEGFTPTLGYVYTIAGAGCVGAALTKTGSVASANSCLTLTGSDTPGLAAAPGATPTATTSGIGVSTSWTVYLDASGNVYYTDAGNARIKVIYAGIAAPLTLQGATLKTGYTYSFAGQGTLTTTSGIPPSQVKLSSAQGVGGDAYGNIFFIDYNSYLFYETYAANGLTALIGGGSPIATAAANATCNGGATGPVMSDAFYDGCPLTQSSIANPRGPLVSDNNGNLYFGDSPGYFLRKFSYNSTFPTTAVGSTSPTQPLAFTSSAPLGPGAVLEGRATGADFTDAGGDTCPTTTAGVTCVLNVAFKPSTPGAHTGSAATMLSGATQGYTLLSGIGTGAGLTVDPATSTITGTTLTPSAIAVDGAGRVYVADTASKSVLRYAAGAPTTVATGLFAPSGLAVDGAGNIFLADSSANTITEVSALAPTAPFTLTTAVAGPHGLATDSAGNLYVADTGNNRILAIPAAAAPGAYTVAAFTGLSAPQAVATDLNSNLYAIDSTHIVKLTPAGVQTNIASTGGTALAVDAAGNVLVTTAGRLVEYPASGAAPVTLATLTTPQGLALDAAGDAYIADSGLKGYLELQRTAGYYKFLNNPDSSTITLTGSGTAPVASTAFTQTDTVDYALTPATTNGCSGALAAGSTCSLAASFAGTSPCVVPDSVVFTAPVGNGAPSLTLTSASVVPCISVTALPASIVYGAAETLTASISGVSSTIGSVTFSSGAAQLAVVPTTAGSATYTYTPAAVGTYAITAAFTPTGATAPTITSAAASFAVTKAAPTIGLATSASSGYTTTSFIFTATVSAAYGTPTGTVNFFSGGAPIGSATLSGKTASLTVSSLTLGTDCITATYASDANFAGVSTTSCTNISVAAGFGVTAASTALSFTSSTYQEAQTYLTIQPGGRTDTLNFACVGLPAKLNCSFSPATLALTGLSTPQTVQLLVANSAAAAQLSPNPVLPSAIRTVALAGLPIAALLLFARRRRTSLGLLLALSTLAATLTGCGKSPTATIQTGGTYNFSVTVSNGTATLQTLNFTLTIPN